MIEFRKNYNFSQAITEKIAAVNAEDPAYAADELVELAEEILQQIAAVGMVQYLKHTPQKEVYNDFLIQLFNSSGHDYNAGPLYRWAANMIKECGETRNSPRFAFFWEKSGDLEVLSHKVHRLAELRNSVMHGFFVLPPERNLEEAVHIQNLLNDLADADFFDVKADYHFWGEAGFTGKWNITEDEEWKHLMADTPFGSLCKRIVSEQQESFWAEEEKAFEKGQENLVPDDLKAFIKDKNQGAFALWVHPANTAKADELFAATGSWLKSSPDTIFAGYALHDNGITYTGNFLMQRLLQVLNTQNKALPKGKKAEDHIKALRSEHKDKKVVVLIQHFHTALFSPLHVSKWANFLFENNIMLVAVGNHYEHFNGFFNAYSVIEHAAVAPSPELALDALRNYLRFKGPSHERADERDDVQLLEKILAHILQELAAGNSIYARRFADEHEYNIEYVHEIFALLHPWVKSSRETFEADTVDELYGFPSVMTEVTPIYLALGRRDVKLEYQHKVMSL
jgi:hypothetical protein